MWRCEVNSTDFGYSLKLGFWEHDDEPSGSIKARNCLNRCDTTNFSKKTSVFLFTSFQFEFSHCNFLTNMRIMFVFLVPCKILSSKYSQGLSGWVMSHLHCCFCECTTSICQRLCTFIDQNNYIFLLLSVPVSWLYSVCNVLLQVSIWCRVWAWWQCCISCY